MSNENNDVSPMNNDVSPMNNDVSPTNNKFNQKQYDSMRKVIVQLQNFAKKLIDLGKMDHFDKKCPKLLVNDPLYTKLNCSNDPAVLDVIIKKKFSDVNTMPNDDEFQNNINDVLKQIDDMRYYYNNQLIGNKKDLKFYYAEIANQNVINVLNACKILNELVVNAHDSDEFIGKAYDIVTKTDELMKYTGKNYDAKYTGELYSSLVTKITELRDEYKNNHPTKSWIWKTPQEKKEEEIRHLIYILKREIEKQINERHKHSNNKHGGSNRKQTIRRRIHKSKTKKRKSNTKKRK
jgi:hypothetical protein